MKENKDNLHPVNTIKPFKRFCMTIGELPASYLETMSYYEMLVWFTKFLQDTVIPTINNNAEAIDELQDKYIEFTDTKPDSRMLEDKYGMFVEGFVTLTADNGGVNLNVPFLSFFGGARS